MKKFALLLLCALLALALASCSASDPALNADPTETPNNQINGMLVTESA